MSGASSRKRPIRTLLGTTVRRSISVGKLYIGLGTGFPVFIGVVLVLASPQTAFAVTYPVLIPLFAVLGSMGGLQTFASDRTKGVFEYLIAYGVSPRSLFTNGLVCTAALVSLVVSIALVIPLTLAVTTGAGISMRLAQAILLYTLPMSFAASLFTATVGMIWAAASTPRSGINGPVGIAPLIGVGPTLVGEIVAEALPAGDFFYVSTGLAFGILAAMAGLLALSARLMSRERFLSPL